MFGTGHQIANTARTSSGGREEDCSGILHLLPFSKGVLVFLQVFYFVVIDSVFGSELYTFGQSPVIRQQNQAFPVRYHSTSPQAATFAAVEIDPFVFGESKPSVSNQLSPVAEVSRIVGIRIGGTDTIVSACSAPAEHINRSLEVVVSEVDVR